MKNVQVPYSKRKWINLKNAQFLYSNVISNIKNIKNSKLCPYLDIGLKLKLFRRFSQHCGRRGACTLEFRFRKLEFRFRILSVFIKAALVLICVQVSSKAKHSSIILHNDTCITNFIL